MHTLCLTLCQHIGNDSPYDLITNRSILYLCRNGHRNHFFFLIALCATHYCLNEHIKKFFSFWCKECSCIPHTSLFSRYQARLTSRLHIRFELHQSWQERRDVTNQWPLFGVNKDRVTALCSHALCWSRKWRNASGRGYNDATRK